MSRVIKFRAWDHINKEMVYESATKSFFNAFLSNCDILRKYEIVMQFTGLHDKNGEEIYEGDIVSTTDVYSNAIHLVEYFGSKFTANNRMRPKESAWLSDNGKCYDLDFLNSYGAGLSVIGNIHENPELL